MIKMKALRYFNLGARRIVKGEEFFAKTEAEAQNYESGNPIAVRIDEAEKLTKQVKKG